MLLIPGLAGCARFHPQPLSPVETAAQLEARTLEAPALHRFLETNLSRSFPEWPAKSWDFDMLTLAAFYYHPSLEVARAQWRAAQGGIKTAGGRLNPSVSAAPAYNGQIPGAPSPWIVPLTFDVPVETAGKRQRRTEQAQHLSESARLNIATTAWAVRAGVRAALLDLYSARETESLLAQQESAQAEVARLLQGQLDAGRWFPSRKSLRRELRLIPRSSPGSRRNANPPKPARRWSTPWA